MHKNPPRLKGARPRLRPHMLPNIEDMRAEIRHEIEAMERHGTQRLARDRDEWARHRPVAGDDGNA